MSNRTSSAYQIPQAAKAASLIYFNYGNSKTITLVQETLKLKKGMQDYQRTVLLKPETLPPWADLSEKDEKLADVKDQPTKTNLFKHLIQLARDGYYIDLFLFAHGNTGQFGQEHASAGSENLITADDIASRLAPAATGFVKMPIRIVWGTNCYGHTLGETWRDVGAKATAGARYVRFYPNSWGNFIDAWNHCNVSFDDAVGNADTDMVRTVVQTYILMVDAPAQKRAGKWDGCPGLKNVLGDDSCARDYFLSCWIDKGEWQPRLSGKDNMNYSSYMLRGGDKQITKNTRPKWL
jgi:hypothetical protein